MDLPTQIQERWETLGLRMAEVEERFVRGSGPGGQKINKTSSTVWLRHTPTGTEVRCQQERSQAANRERAWALLCEKLETRRKAAEMEVRQAMEKARRKGRKKSGRQKAKQVAGKRLRAKIKAGRGRRVEE